MVILSYFPFLLRTKNILVFTLIFFFCLRMSPRDSLEWEAETKGPQIFTAFHLIPLPQAQVGREIQASF